MKRVNNHFDIKSNSLRQGNAKAGYVLNKQISIIDYNHAQNIRKNLSSRQSHQGKITNPDELDIGGIY